MATFGSALTDRMLEGMMYRDALQRQDEQQQYQRSIQERQLAAQEQQRRIANEMNAFKTAYTIASGAGDDAQTVFKNVFKHFLPDSGEGDIPSVSFKADMAEIDTPQWKLIGNKKSIAQAAEAIGKNPERAQEVLTQLMRTGLGRIEMKAPKQDKFKFLMRGGEAWRTNEATGMIEKIPGITYKESSGGGNSMFDKWMRNPDAVKEYLQDTRAKPTPEILYDREGNVIMARGFDNPSVLTRRTENTAQQKFIDLKENFARLDGIKNKYRSGYLSFKNMLGRLVDSAKIFFTGPSALNSQERKNYEDYYKFRQETVTNLSLFIKEMTGAAMSEKEVKRLRQVMPNSGIGSFDGIFDADNDIKFQTKLDNMINLLKAATKRYNDLLTQGLPLENVQKQVKDFILNKAGTIPEGEPFTTSTGKSLRIE